MKNYLVLAVLLLVSCSQVQLKSKAPLPVLEAMLTPEELKIHRCLNSGKTLNFDLKKECLTGTPYESLLSRTPSSDDEMIMKNNWFFDSKENVEKFYKMSRGFLHAHSLLVKKTAGKLINKSGIGVEGSFYAGVGRGWAAEFAVHQNKLGFFCSPSWSLQTDVGFEADVSVVRTLSCNSNEEVAGEDISFGASISGELIGLPVGVGLSYGMSIDPARFTAKINQAKQQGLLNLSQLKEELNNLNSPAMKREISKNYKYALPLLTLALKPIALLSVNPPAMANHNGLHGFVRDMLKHDRSLSLLFKTFYAHQLKKKLLTERMPNLNAFLGALDAAVTGCDSLGGSASVGVSLVPVSLGVSFTEGVLLAEVGAPELLTFGRLSVLALMNPFLLPSQDLRNVVKVSRSLVAIPTKVQRQCL